MRERTTIMIAWSLGAIIACYFLSFQIMNELAHVSRRSYTVLRLILFPGVIVHELSHALACLLTGTPIHELSFWDERGGHVIHDKPKLPFVTQPIISFAPFPVGIFLLVWLSHYITLSHWLISLLIGLFMVSVAGTLAPSKADFIPALEGSIVLLIVFGATYYFYPQLFSGLDVILTSFNHTMLFVTALLAAFWLSFRLLRVAISK